MFRLLSMLLLLALCGISAAAEVVPDYCGPLSVSIRADRSTYRLGEDVRLSVEVGEDAYVWVLSTDGDGVTRQLFPNYFDRENYVRRGDRLRLPGRGYSLTTTSPGTDTITVYAQAVGRDDWTPPRALYDFSRSQPFPSVRGGAEGMRRQLDDSLNSAWKSKGKAAPRVGIAVEPWRPGWGEDSIRIRVRGPHGDDWGGDGRPPHGHDDDECDPRDFGRLVIRTSPYWAEAFVDGRYRGRTPLTLELPPGRHEIKLTSRGYRSVRKTVTIEPRRQEQISVKMKRD